MMIDLLDLKQPLVWTVDDVLNASECAAQMKSTAALFFWALGHERIFGSSASRTPSPKRIQASMVKARTKDG